jgi:protein gp37
MTVIGTNISWTNSTWNFAVDCTKLSDGCDNCYAEALVDGPRTNRQFGHRFEDVRLHPSRLEHVKRFRPIVGPDGRKSPHMVFVNSMSDWCHDAIPDAFIHQVLDIQEANPSIIFQLLTKRPVRARKLLVDRYGNSGVPRNFWIGTSVEDNRVAGRINILRRLKEQTGGTATIFLSVEPVIGPTDQLDFSGIDQIITGGESGPGARIMQREWLMPAIEQAMARGIALWHKQSGTRHSHPNLSEAPSKPQGIVQRFQWLIDNGWEVLGHVEKGGATVDRQTYRQLPKHFHDLKADMNGEVRS